jgi:hypothetical protein
MTTHTEQHLGEALEDLVSAQPFQPDTSAIQRRGRTLRRRGVAVRATAGVATIAVGALVAVTVAGTATHRGTKVNVATSNVATSPGVGPAPAQDQNDALIELAAYITANATPQVGDATLVERTQSYPDHTSIQGFDLFTDSGEYFYAETESGLPAVIKANDDQGDGGFAREIAAAEYAVHGSLAVADQRMAYAVFADGRPPRFSGQYEAQGTDEAHPVSRQQLALGAAKGRTISLNTDNYIWEDSEDALEAGAGNPQVRAGILRILSTLPGITVTHTDDGGQPALAITATGAPDLPANYHETITINASTGIPIGFVGGTNGSVPSVTVTYRVSRVTVSAIEAGQF